MKKRSLTYIAIALVLFTIYACTKQAPSPSTVPTAVKTGPYDNLLVHSATLYGWCFIEGDEEHIPIFGIEFSDTELGDSASRVTADSRGAENEYFCRLENLKPGTTYQYRAYACHMGEYFFGETRTFELPPVEAALSARLEKISFHSALIEGELKVKSEGTISSTAVLYYGDSADTAESLKAVGTQVPISLNADGSYSVTVPGLAAETTYSFVAAARVDGAEFTSAVFSYVTHSIPMGGVDLGLSVVWASCNLGAERPEQYGTYYHWGGTEDLMASDKSFDYSNCPYYVHPDKWSKYVTNPNCGTVDNRTTLEPADDAASITLGDRWRIPTAQECRELLSECAWTFTPNYRYTGVAGITLTSRKEGYTDRSIFLPMTGFRLGPELVNSELVGGFWTSSLHESMSDMAHDVTYDQGGIDVKHTFRPTGRPLRPVSE